MTPNVSAVAYGLTIPLGIAVGLAARTTYPPNSSKNLVINGIVEFVSASILMYTSLVEFMAHEILFNKQMQTTPFGRVAAAFALIYWGSGDDGSAS